MKKNQTALVRVGVAFYFFIFIFLCVYFIIIYPLKCLKNVTESLTRQRSISFMLGVVFT